MLPWKLKKDKYLPLLSVRTLSGHHIVLNIVGKDKPKALKRDSIYNIDNVVLEKRVSAIYLHLL